MLILLSVWETALLSGALAYYEQTYALAHFAYGIDFDWDERFYYLYLFHLTTEVS